jgi:hypothetical protein
MVKINYLTLHTVWKIYSIRLIVIELINLYSNKSMPFNAKLEFGVVSIYLYNL